MTQHIVKRGIFFIVCRAPFPPKIQLSQIIRVQAVPPAAHRPSRLYCTAISSARALASCDSIVGDSTASKSPNPVSSYSVSCFAIPSRTSNVKFSPRCSGESLFQFVYHAQRLLLMIESPKPLHQLAHLIPRPRVQTAYARCHAPGKSPGQVLIRTQRPRQCPPNLRHFQRVRQPCPIIVPLGNNKHLRLFQPPKRSRMQNPVAVTLKRRPVPGCSASGYTRPLDSRLFIPYGASDRYSPSSNCSRVHSIVIHTSFPAQKIPSPFKPDHNTFQCARCTPRAKRDVWSCGLHAIYAIVTNLLLRPTLRAPCHSERSEESARSRAAVPITSSYYLLPASFPPP